MVVQSMQALDRAFSPISVALWVAVHPEALRPGVAASIGLTYSLVAWWHAVDSPWTRIDNSGCAAVGQ